MPLVEDRSDARSLLDQLSAPTPSPDADVSEQVIFLVAEWVRQHRPARLALFQKMASGMALKDIAGQLGIGTAAVQQQAKRLRDDILRHRKELQIDDLLDTLWDDPERHWP